MNAYLIATAEGGIMEKPHFTYTNYDIIESHSDDDALEIYNTKHHCDYFYGVVMAKAEEGMLSIAHPEVTPVLWIIKLMRMDEDGKGLIQQLKLNRLMEFEEEQSEEDTNRERDERRKPEDFIRKPTRPVIPMTTEKGKVESNLWQMCENCEERSPGPWERCPKCDTAKPTDLNKLKAEV